MCVAVYTFEAQEEDELDVKEGDKVEVIGTYTTRIPLLYHSSTTRLPLLYHSYTTRLPVIGLLTTQLLEYVNRSKSRTHQQHEDWQ